MRKYGKLLLSAYIMKKIKSGKSQKGAGIVRKYAKLALGTLLLKKLNSIKFEKEVKPVEEVELIETESGASRMGIGKIIMGALAGATVIYAIKKYTAKKSGHKIEVQ
jgi:hypothetical protein